MRREQKKYFKQTLKFFNSDYKHKNVNGIYKKIVNLQSQILDHFIITSPWVREKVNTLGKNIMKSV